MLPGATLGEATPAIVAGLFWAIGFGLAAFTLLRAGLLGGARPATVFLLAGLLLAALAELGYAVATPFAVEGGATLTAFRVGFGVPAALFVAGLSTLAWAGAVSAAGGVLPSLGAAGGHSPAAGEAANRAASLRCGACGQPVAADARFCPACGRAIS